jgi:hypothetical protein
MPDAEKVTIRFEKKGLLVWSGEEEGIIIASPKTTDVKKDRSNGDKKEKRRSASGN